MFANPAPHTGHLWRWGGGVLLSNFLLLLCSSNFETCLLDVCEKMGWSRGGLAMAPGRGGLCGGRAMAKPPRGHPIFSPATTKNTAHTTFVQASWDGRIVSVVHAGVCGGQPHRMVRIGTTCTTPLPAEGCAATHILPVHPLTNPLTQHAVPRTYAHTHARTRIHTHTHTHTHTHHPCTHTHTHTLTHHPCAHTRKHTTCHTHVPLLAASAGALNRFHCMGEPRTETWVPFLLCIVFGPLTEVHATHTTPPITHTHTTHADSLSFPPPLVRLYTHIVHAGVCVGQPHRMVPLAPTSASRGVCSNTQHS